MGDVLGTTEPAEQDLRLGVRAHVGRNAFTRYRSSSRLAFIVWPPMSSTVRVRGKKNAAPRAAPETRARHGASDDAIELVEDDGLGVGRAHVDSGGVDRDHLISELRSPSLDTLGMA